jgi:hypothetical protein
MRLNMRGRFIAAFILLLLPVAATARPIEQGRFLPKIDQIDASGRKDQVRSNRPDVFSAATAGTTFFGGTFWAADSQRWESYENQLWTFDSGVGSSLVPVGGPSHLSVPTSGWVNPYKQAGLHATMEGWVGFDNTYSEIPYFRRLGVSDPRWTAPVCVGTPAGLQGNYSFWAGVFPQEASALCYAGGQGYGNAWRVCIEKSFSYASGNATLSFQYKNETEDGFDYTHVYCDTTGAGTDVEIISYTGAVSGTANLVLTSGQELPRSAKPVKIKFCVASDGAWSDQDGLNPTACGAFAVDRIMLTGALHDTSDFELNEHGWVLSPPFPGLGGDWANIYALNDLPLTLAPCACAISDSVLAFFDNQGLHNNYQDNLAASPWIDLKQYGKVGAPGKILKTNLYADLPLRNYIFTQFTAQWYPEKCLQTGKLITSPWITNGFVYYFGGVPQCTSTLPGTLGTEIDFSGFIPGGAEEVRIGLGVLSYCRFFANCTQISNRTPWFDLAGLGVYGDIHSPFIFSDGVDRAQDSFPQNGLLTLTGTGRIDCNNVQGDSQPAYGTTLGDTLIVTGAVGNAEVYVHFRVRPGPGTNIANFNAWYNSHGASPIDGTFKRARCDTAEYGASGPLSGNWMTTYHEADPNFASHGATDQTKDPTDYPPYGGTWRLSHDIFPDNLLTSGSRLEYFFSANNVGETISFLDPSTAPAVPYEVEIMPSSYSATNTFNCVLYVEHSGGGAKHYIENALGSILGFGSANVESTLWDRYDVNAPGSNQGSLGRPGSSDYGATLYQLLGYRTILWECGDLNAFNLHPEDAAVLDPWLKRAVYPQDPNRYSRLYLSGNGIVYSGLHEEDAGVHSLLQHTAGVTLQTGCAAGTYRLAGCPDGAPEDATPCVGLRPEPRALVAGTLPGRSVPHVAQGNACPELRSFDVLDVLPPTYGSNAPDESYSTPIKTARYASVATEAQLSGRHYKIVTDGVSVLYRRDGGTACSFSEGGMTAITERLREVLGFFVASGNDICTPQPPIAVPPIAVIPRTLLLPFAPNPFVAGTSGRIRFSMAEQGRALIEVLDLQGRLVKVLYDGVAKEGDAEAFWDGRDASGHLMGNGVYFIRLRALDQELSGKLVLVGKRG